MTLLLATSNRRQLDLVRFTPLGLSLEELSKVWSIFQSPYALPWRTRKRRLDRDRRNAATIAARADAISMFCRSTSL
jgi:hypothetical protein